MSDLKVKLNVTFSMEDFKILMTILNHACNLKLIQANEKYIKACTDLKDMILENSYYV